MEYRRILERIRATVRQGSYLVPASAPQGAQRKVLADIAGSISDPDNDPEGMRRRIHQLHAAGRIDRVMMLSALGVLAASPSVRDYAEAARLAGQQEFAAIEEGGPHEELYRASADRHRGVLAYLLGRYEVALEWFARALGRERSAENVGNVMSALLRLGEHQEARALQAEVHAHFAPEVARALDQRIAVDDDLVRLRST